MDMNVFEIDRAGKAMEILHPITNAPLKDGNGKPVTVMLVGMDSDEWRQYHRSLLDDRLNETTKKTQTAHTIEKEGLEALAVCFKSWSGVTLDGKPLECTRDNAVMLMRRFPSFRRQVDEFVGKHANFLKASAKR